MEIRRAWTHRLAGNPAASAAPVTENKPRTFCERVKTPYGQKGIAASSNEVWAARAT